MASFFKAAEGVYDIYFMSWCWPWTKFFSLQIEGLEF